MIIGLMGKASSGKDSISEIMAPVHLVWMDGKWTDVARSPDRRVSAVNGSAVQIALADPLKTFCREVYDFSIDQLWGESSLRNAPDMRYPRTWPSHKFSPNPERCARCDVMFQRCTCTTESVMACPLHNPEAYGKGADSACIDYLTPREALQQLGTEWGRRMYNSTWIELGLRRAHELLSEKRTRRAGDQDAHTFSASWIIERTDLVVISDVRFENEVAAIAEAGGEVWRVVRPVPSMNGDSSKHLSETEQDGIPDAALHEIIKNDGSLQDLRTKVQHAMIRMRGRALGHDVSNVNGDER